MRPTGPGMRAVPGSRRPWAQATIATRSEMVIRRDLMAGTIRARPAVSTSTGGGHGAHPGSPFPMTLPCGYASRRGQQSSQPIWITPRILCPRFQDRLEGRLRGGRSPGRTPHGLRRTGRQLRAEGHLALVTARLCKDLPFTTGAYCNPSRGRRQRVSNRQRPSRSASCRAPRRSLASGRRQSSGYFSPSTAPAG